MGRILDFFNNRFNYTDFHELNIDWLITTIKELVYQLDNFVNLNTIKYANPIQWNIATQYEMNTIVIDPGTGTAYISVQPVPAGVAITNTDYWTVIFSLDFSTTNSNITLRDDGFNVLSTFTSVINDWLIWNNTLYKVTQNINLNEAYVPGYNISRYTVELFISDYVSTLTNAITNASNAIIAIIGDLNDLNTSDKSTIVNAINEVLNEVLNDVTTLSNNVGDLTDLNTSDKTSIVNAINEVLAAISTSLNVLGTVISDNITYDSAHSFNDFTKSFNDSVITSANDIINNSKLSDITINSSNNPGLWNNQDVHRSKIETTNNIAIDYSNDTPHSNLKVIGNDVKGDHFGVLVDNNANGDGIIISNNSIISNTGDPIEINTPYNDSTRDFKHVIITSNLLDNADLTPAGTQSGFGIGLARNKGTVVVGNLSKKSRVNGLHIEDNSSDIVVGNNVFKNCKRFGAYVHFGYSTNTALDNKGDVGIVSNNIFHHRPDDVTDIGLYKIYAGTVDDSFGIYRNNIIEGFDVGISLLGGGGTGHDFDIDGCIVKDCNVGIDLNLDTHGTLTLINCTKGVRINNNMSHIDKLIAYGIAGENIFDIAGTHYDFTIDEIILNMKGTFTSGVAKNIIPIPTHFKGTITLSQNNFCRIYDVNDGTVTSRNNNVYGSAIPSLSTDNGYYTIAISVGGTYNVKVSIKGDYLMFA